MPFSKEIIEKVWNKGRVVSGFNEKFVRKDCCGAWIIRDKYGDRNDDYGWEIDHVYPKSLGGDDSIDNLRPMQWQNNDSKNDDYPAYTSVIVANGNNNVQYNTKHVVNSVLQKKIREIYYDKNK